MYPAMNIRLIPKAFQLMMHDQKLILKPVKRIYKFTLYTMS